MVWYLCIKWILICIFNKIKFGQLYNRQLKNKNSVVHTWVVRTWFLKFFIFHVYLIYHIFKNFILTYVNFRLGSRVMVTLTKKKLRPRTTFLIIIMRPNFRAHPRYKNPTLICFYAFTFTINLYKKDENMKWKIKLWIFVLGKLTRIIVKIW